MVFKDYNSTNNADWILQSPISNSSPLLLLWTGQWEAFPETNFLIKLEEFIDKKVVKREIVECTTRTWDTLNITRAVWTCRLSETSWVQQSQAQSFKEWTIITLVYNAESEADLKNELKLKAAITDTVLKTWDQTIGWVKTFTNAPIMDWSNIYWISAEVTSTSLNYMLWTTWEIWKAYSLVNYEQITWWTDNDFWSTAQPEVAQSFYAQSIDIIDIKLMIKTISSPSDDILIEIQWDNAGVPDGVAVTNWTSNVINYTALSATFTEETFTFASIPTLTAETLYHIVIKRSSANDAVNYYAAESAWSDVQIGTMSLNTGSWANVDTDLYFKLPIWYKLATLWGTNPIWILQAPKVIWETGKFNKDYDNNQVNLVPESNYSYNKLTWVFEINSSWEYKAISETEINSGYSNSFPKIIYTSDEQTLLAWSYLFTHNLWLTQNDVIKWRYRTRLLWNKQFDKWLAEIWIYNASAYVQQVEYWNVWPAAIKYYAYHQPNNTQIKVVTDALSWRIIIEQLY